MRGPRATVSISVTAPSGSCPMVPITSGWPRMADQHDLEPALVVTSGLPVDLGDQRAGRVEVEQVARRAASRDRLRHAVRREHHRSARCPGSRPAPRRTPRPWRAARRPRTGCARSRAGHRPARRTSRAPARRSGSPGRRRRKSRGGQPSTGSIPVCSRASGAGVSAATWHKGFTVVETVTKLATRLALRCRGC